jgi:hypothetical protein
MDERACFVIGYRHPLPLVHDALVNQSLPLYHSYIPPLTITLVFCPILQSNKSLPSACTLFRVQTHLNEIKWMTPELHDLLGSLGFSIRIEPTLRERNLESCTTRAFNLTSLAAFIT